MIAVLISIIVIQFVIIVFVMWVRKPNKILPANTLCPNCLYEAASQRISQREHILALSRKLCDEVPSLLHSRSKRQELARKACHMMYSRLKKELDHI